LDPLQLYKSLADETRLRCLLLIAQEVELCVCELTIALDEIQPKISRHLAQLRKSGILSDRRQGQWIFYRLNPALPDWARHVIDETNVNNPQFIQANLQRLFAMGSRPVRTEQCCQPNGNYYDN
jgi:ArsR family transcriptional regulator, arsenate/arsenite/antimonite-responsive transcriptional repressor